MLNEFAKMRHLRLLPLAGVFVAGAVGLTVLTAVVSPAFAEADAQRWPLLLAGVSLATGLTSPLLLAVFASRLVDIEHQGNGWLLAATSGVGAGALCRLKVAAAGLVVAALTVLQTTVLVGLGSALGAPTPVPVSAWCRWTASVLVVNLSVLAVQTLVSAAVDNQLVGLGLGLLATLVAAFAGALPTWLAVGLPWGHYALMAPADYRDGVLVTLDPSGVGLAVMGLSVALGFWLTTVRIDRQEA